MPTYASMQASGDQQRTQTNRYYISLALVVDEPNSNQAIASIPIAFFMLKSCSFIESEMDNPSQTNLSHADFQAMIAVSVNHECDH